ELAVFYNLPTTPPAVLHLYDIHGRHITTQSLDLSGLPAGMYVWRLALPGGYEQYEASGKLVVE
ncbi:MAG TPA: T9SS type A sorting domain-containing protein, partial [Chitinophagales bacterium]|nr:T9SS type A sorting domain-containing protein [Chitinophagales bacterium]